MEKPNEILIFAVSLIIKATILAARWSAIARMRGLKSICSSKIDLAKENEIIFLHDRINQLETQVSILQKLLKKDKKNPRYTLKERLFILWHIEYFRIPKRKVTNYFGIARSTLYRWLKKMEDVPRDHNPVNKTPAEIAILVWEITKANIDWGRVRISNQLALLGIFLSASTVRNILNRPKPKNSPSSENTKQLEEHKERSIPASYPGHVWSVDHTIFLRWGFMPTYLLVAIDHYSRKVMCALPLDGPNAGWTINALESAFELFGAPKHIIMDQGSVFTSTAFREMLNNWNVKPRWGAIGKHGSIAVTERVIKTLKYEWLMRVALIKGFDHLTVLCEDFIHWYNDWRPHMTLNGARPSDVYNFGQVPKKPLPGAKTVPSNIFKFEFRETHIKGFRIKKAA